MMKLSNGAIVHAAFVQPAEHGMKPHGLVLAETPTDWVVWNCYWDEDTTGDVDGITHEVWEAENGDYFQKSHTGLDPKMAAEFCFGLKIRRSFTAGMLRGAGITLIGAKG